VYGDYSPIDFFGNMQT